MLLKFTPMFHSSARPHLPLKTTNMDGIGARIKLNFKLSKHSAQSKSGVNILRSAHQHSYCLSLGVPDTDKTITFIVITLRLSIYHIYPHSSLHSLFSDAGVRSIAVYCPGLRELSVSQCPNVSDSGLCELAKLGPSLRYDDSL